VLFTGILELPNGRSFLLNRELDGDKMVVACDIEYLRRFTRLENLRFIWMNI
jgi:hypothetical protein